MMKVDRLMVLSRVVKEKGTHKDYFADRLKEGYIRVSVDGQN